MKNFSAEQAIQVAEAVARSAAPSTGRRAPQPPPAGVTFEHRPLTCALIAPRWTLSTLIAAAPLWLRAAVLCVAAFAAIGAILGALTVIGLLMMLHNARVI